MAILDRVLRGLAVLGCAALLPRALLGQREPSEDVAFAHSVADAVTSGVSASSFHTGSARFDGEWAFGTFLMAPHRGQ
jgi:hypothetical protein